MSRTILAVAFLGCPLLVNAQPFSPWSPPANLGPIVNTASADGCLFVSKDELALYLTSNRPGGYGGFDLYVSQRNSVSDPWGPPQNLGATVNSASNDICPRLTNDGHTMFLTSSRPGGCGGQDLYVSRRHDKRDNFGWAPPVNLGCTVNTAAEDFTSSFIEDDGGPAALYFSSTRPGGAGGSDIYVSVLAGDGTFGPAAAVPELNTPSDDQRPTVRKDGLEIIFESTRPGSLANDLWVSTRPSQASPWSPPVHLGLTLNSASIEFAPTISFDRLTLYFVSDRPGGQGSLDIYVSTRAKPGH
jgi:hypothetical protein